MASTMEAGARTPSPPPSIQTPPAPRHGYLDSWEPYSPRKSARISSRQSTTAKRTPSPQNARKSSSGSPRRKSNKSSDTAAITPAMSPRKRPHPAALDTRRQASGSLTAEGTANAAAALGLASDDRMISAQKSTTSQTTGMLPTPSKTPQKPPNSKTAANIQSFARNLFHSEEEAMPSPKKRRAKKYSGVTLESFTVEENEDPIAIFTDSQDRVPEKDASDANPFYGDNVTAAEPSKRQSKRRMVHIPGEGTQPVDEVANREDGMVFVFRGKKFFRPFSDMSQAEDQDSTVEDGESRLARPLTRASVKPKLLFPSQKKSAELEEEDDEEALTDVEDMHMFDETPQTPQKSQATAAKTPEAPKYAPVSPPDTKRTTRATNKLDDMATPVKKMSRSSPFDLWPRTKEHKGQATTKRTGESLAAADPKRTRA